MELVVTEHTIRIKIIKPTDRLAALEVPGARKQLDQLLSEGITNFVIDLSETPFLDSAGMAVLVSLLKSARQKGGTVKLVWPKREAVRRILNLTKFDRVFNMVESVEEAVKNF
jgi:anti-anti-sigma factor